jgi:hypothetical protein
MTPWHSLRDKLDPLLDRMSEGRPTTYRRALEIARSATPNLIWSFGQELYARVTGHMPDESTIQIFLDCCPPFRAVCFALCGPWYDISLAPAVHKKLAGRNDQLMAAYLPYCDRFVTEDNKQLQRLRDIATEMGVSCEVVSHQEFCSAFEVTV